MKKIALIFTIFAICAAAFAVSYKNNTYQKLAEEYARKAVVALNAGEYALSEEYAQKAAENAALSKAFIDSMNARYAAEMKIAEAQKKMDWAKGIGADVTFPTAYTEGQNALDNAKGSFEKEDYENATRYAQMVLDALAGIYQVTPLPKFYIVRPWAETRDCYWNISGRKYIYNNPLLWENLYQANKSRMPRPNDPNLILPGMKMEIPSIQGELRDGTYDPKKEYDTFNR